MAKQKTVTDRIILKGHTEIHPALDYYNDKMIISVGRPGITVFDDESRTIGQHPVCIISDGDCFILNITELLNRKLYYLKELDLPNDRWELDNQIDFVEQLRKSNVPHVNIQALHSEIAGMYEYLLDFNDNRLYDFFSCFTIYTYFFPIFDSAPVVHLWGPAGSGKTKIMEIMALLCFNPVTSGNITEAGVFRLVEGRRGVVLLDESEDLSKSEKGHAITNLILNGYRKGNLIYRIDKIGKTMFSSHYNVFSPKVIANITGLDKEALVSRAIRVTTSSAKDIIKGNRHTSLVKDRAIELRNQLYRVCLTEYQVILDSKNSLPQFGLSGRSMEIWEGVLSVANVMQNEVWHNVSTLALESTRSMQAELQAEDPTIELLEHLVEFVKSDRDQFYPNEQLWSFVTSRLDGQFSSKRHLSQALSKMGFRSAIQRQDKHTKRGYVLSNPKIVARLSQ